MKDKIQWTQIAGQKVPFRWKKNFVQGSGQIFHQSLTVKSSAFQFGKGHDKLDQIVPASNGTLQRSLPTFESMKIKYS